MALPLLLGAAKALAGSAAKATVKKKAKDTAKKFVSGKDGKKKGGALVKREKKKITKAKVKPTESFVGGSVASASSSSSSTPKASIVGGKVDYEKMTQQLESMVGVSEALKKAYADQYKVKGDESKKKDNARQKEKRENRESQLESKSTSSGSIGGNLMAMGKKFNIFGFLLNTLMGGLAVMFIKNFENIKNFFSGFGELFNEKMNFLRWGLTALRKPIQKVTNLVTTVFKPFFKKMRKPLKKVVTKVGTVVAGGLKKIGTGILNFTKDMMKRVVNAGSSGAKAAAAKGATSRSGTRGATNVGKRGLRSGPASAAAKKKFTAAGAKRLGTFSKLFKRVPFVGPLIGIGIDMAMGESIDRAVAGAIGATLGSAILGVLGTVVPGVGNLIGGIAGAALGDYIGKKIYDDIKSKITGENTEPLVDDTVTKDMIDERRNMKAGDQVQVQGKTMVWNGLQFVTPQQYQQQTGKAPNPLASTPPASPLSGTNADKAKKMHDYIVGKGYTSAQAKGIVANIERESTFNPTARSGDDKGPGGLFQWKGSRQTAKVAELVNSGNWKGQIDYALQEDVGPRYKAETANMSAFDASMWWAEKWERPLSLQNARNKHSSFLPRYNFGAGASQTTQSQQPVSQTTPQAQVTTRTVPSGQQTLVDKVPFKDFSRSAAEGGKGSVGVSSQYRSARRPNHSGIDIGTQRQKGYYVSLKADGKVTVNQFGPRAGHMLFIKVGNLEYVFMHLARKSSLKVGENYKAGTPIGEIGNTGKSFGEHLHFEVRPAGGGSGTGIDPNPYLKMLEIGKLGTSDGTATTSTAQVATGKSTSAQTARRVEQRASYEGGGSQVVTVPIPVATGGQQVSPYNESGVGGMMMSGGSTKALLNSYYKSKLMGFLYKQG